jgi:hypothetical protein
MPGPITSENAMAVKAFTVWKLVSPDVSRRHQ